jgi:hypothetical protein
MGKADGRGRRRSDKQKSLRDQLIVSPIFATAGAEAADRWLRALGLAPTPRWHCEIATYGGADVRFDLNIYAEEWGFCFRAGERASWIRVTDVAFVHGRDDFQLLAKTPDLLAIGPLLDQLEHDHGVAFARATASVRTNLTHAAVTVRDWLVEPPTIE